MKKTTQVAAKNNAASDPKPLLQLVSVREQVSEEVASEDSGKSGMVIVFGFVVLACVLVGMLIGWLA